MKRVLLISHNALSMHQNNGKTLASIFSDWPMDNIAQLYFNKEVPESLKFRNFMRITDEDVIKRILSFGLIKHAGQVLTPTNEQGIASHTDAGTLGFIKELAKQHEWMKLIARDLIFSTDYWYSSNIREWIASFKPDSIFLLGGNSRFAFKIATRLSSDLKIPLDIYITDDYIINSAPDNFIEKAIHKKLTRTYIEAISHSRHLFAIGQEMASEFKRFFGREFHVLMNITNSQLPSTQHTRPSAKDGAIDFVYVGGIHLGRDKTLAALGKLLGEISSHLSTPISLNVYSVKPPSPSVLKTFRSSNVTYCGAIHHHAVEDRIQRADFVVHVESFDDQFTSKTKLSVSTKIPEYLSSGACLLAFGPNSLASIKLIEDNKLGIVIGQLNISSDDRSNLINAILSESTRNLLSRNASQYFNANFDSIKIRDTVKKLINQN
ncbi:hypothetical protein [Diaphorobacter sp. JS3051]|uniref:hypothetical protein n=1 Tax=Diaphorobacter sp. JS3051 TaxID=2792224 RepID=UPI0018C9619E|nr:hypothetical protein [Diaphorobacter sp. JS3051]QPN33192.1 hypothetical protein I3K84_21195 [Diaphorobacter sp. JS3051]